MAQCFLFGLARYSELLSCLLEAGELYTLLLGSRLSSAHDDVSVSPRSAGPHCPLESVPMDQGSVERETIFWYLGFSPLKCPWTL